MSVSYAVRDQNGRFSKSTGLSPSKPARAKPKKRVKQKTIVAFVLDQSSSMTHLRESAKKSFNDMLRTVQEGSEREGVDTLVTVISFADHAGVVTPPTPAAQVSPLSYYPTGGNTALFDGFGLAADTVSGFFGADDDNTSVLIIAFTDGEENMSRKYNAHSTRNRIEELQATGRYTVAFNVPPGYRDRFVRQFNIPTDNVREWEATVRGIDEGTQVNTSSIGSYMTARAKGTRAVTNFYQDVTTDLSKVSKKVINRTLDDLSKNFKTLTVGAEQAVKEFVEAKTGKYVIGSAYYQLMKPEKVQPQKAVLLMDKATKAVYGGNDARDLIGLPTDGVTHAKVEPGNHANFEVFVQSTSVNRKLPRGTKVLVDQTKTTNSTPTWDHMAVKPKAAV